MNCVFPNVLETRIVSQAATGWACDAGADGLDLMDCVTDEALGYFNWFD